MHLGIEHRLENDLARLLRRERLQGQRGIAERRGIERGEILELALVATRETRERNVERVDILRFVLGIDLDDDRFVALGALTHRHALEADAFALD